MQKITIKNWAEEDRPREKLMLKGAKTLSDSELLAILIGSGNDKETAVELSKRILQKTENNLNNLGKLSVKELVNNFRGIGPAKAITIVAALELGHRRKVEDMPEKLKITSSQDAYNVLYSLMADISHEEVWALMLDRANKVIHKMQVSKGGISGSYVDIRLIMREAINHYASAIILGHNHPSGTCSPSREDINITHRLRDAAKLLDITLHDHIIVADRKYYSFSDSGAM